MRLENVLALTHGKLINEPYVNNFTNIVFEAKAVKRGDLFIAFNEKEIEEAILNGAYGIMFCKPTQINDFEIAWIKTDNLEDAVKRILRFILIDKEIIAYECSEIVLKLALQVLTESNFVVLHGDIKKLYKSLYNIENSSTILFCPTLTTRDIFTKTLLLPKLGVPKIDIIEQTLFETSFIHNNIFYERQLISPFFIPFLETLLHLLTRININYRLRKFTPIDHFEAVFTNKNFEIKEFGTSDKVLIFEKNSAYIEQEIEFLQKEATWAKTFYLIPQDYQVDEKVQETLQVTRYQQPDEIISILKQNSFHFALIMGADKSILHQPLINNSQATLFDFK